MALDWEKDIVRNPFINPFGWVAGNIRDNNGGTANERVERWAMTQEILPGCGNRAYDPNEDNALDPACQWQGTQSDWEQYRTDWINNCVAANNNGILTSKNKTLAACQAKFDEMARDIRLAQVKKNAIELESVKKLIGSNSPLPYLFAFLFVGLIIYLLMSD